MSWRTNGLVAAAGFIFVFLISLSTNLWHRSLLRAVLAFFLFYFITYLFRAAFGQVVKNTSKPEIAETAPLNPSIHARDDLTAEFAPFSMADKAADSTDNIAELTDHIKTLLQDEQSNSN